MVDFEVILAFAFWIGGVLYALKEVVHVGKYFNSFDDKFGDFKDGWLVKNRKRDAADQEFEMFYLILYDAFLWLIFNTLVTEYLRYKKCERIIPLWQMSLGVTFTFHTIGLFGTFIVILQPILFQASYKFRRKLFVWICSCICLVFITYLKSFSFDNSKLLRYNEVQQYYFIMVLCWMNLRLLGYYLDVVNTQILNHNYIQVLAYSFYLPTLFSGPFIPFSSFVRSNEDSGIKEKLPQRLIVLLISILRFTTWFLVTKYFLHYVYVNALSFQPEVIRSMNSFALYGYGYGMGQFFHLKYVVLYGISTSFAKFDHMLAPSIPKCIGRIHLYSDMWRYFDVGLYKFLVRYIYLPSLREKNIKNKIFSSFLCFLFVYIWHGIQSHILIWATLNFTGIIIENVFTHICCYYNLQRLFNFRLRRLLLSIITSPLLAMSALSNFYFFAGVQIGGIFTERLIYGAWYPTAILLFFLGCCCIVSTEVKRWEVQKQAHKK